MYFIPPKKQKLAVIYARWDPEHPGDLPVQSQVEICRRHCSYNQIPVSHVIQVAGSAEDSLNCLRQLVRTLPRSVDTLLAARSYAYSTLLPELARLCLVFQCRPTWVYSLDAVGPLYQSIFCLEPEDFQLADERYQALL